MATKNGGENDFWQKVPYVVVVRFTENSISELESAF